MVKKMLLDTTCQICGRPTELNSDETIWRHGYRRPGDGTLHGNCGGVNYLPYEQSCARLKEYIGITERNIIELERTLAKFIAEPPEVIHATIRRSSWDKRGEPVDYTRPANFDPNAYHDRFYTYEYEYGNRRHRLEEDIKWTKHALKYMQERVLAWKAPEVQAKQ